VLGSASLLLVQRASGEPLASLGALVAPVDGDWWQYFTAPFAYSDVGYLFVVAIALAIFASGIERRLGTVATAILLIASGSLGALAAAGVASAQNEVEVIAGGNGMALGALAAWFAIRRGDARRSIDQDYDPIGVAIAAAVLLALPIFESSADVFAGLAGAIVGGLAGWASALSPSD
jgi:membrane associated rhomboid family serine protease